MDQDPQSAGNESVLAQRLAKAIGAQLYRDGNATVISPPEADFQAPPWRMAVAELAVIRAHGPQAGEFLHGQLTQDMERLRPGQVSFAAYCSPKGRMLASFIVAVVAENDFLLITSADLAPSISKRLRMFVMRSKVSIELLDDSLLPIALVVPRESLTVPLEAMQYDDNARTLRLSDVRINEVTYARQLMLPAEDEWLAQWARLDFAQHVSSAWFRATEVLAAEVRVSTATSDRFVPQMVNFELIGGVDFGKGCFTGQEVIARSQNLSKLKRRMMVAISDHDLEPGADIEDDDGTPVASVVERAPGAAIGEGAKTLLLLETDSNRARASSTAQLPNGLAGMELPYDIPEHKPFVRPKL